MVKIVTQTCGKPRPWTTLHFAAFAVVLVVVLLGSDPMPAAGDEGTAGFGIGISWSAKATIVTAFEQRSMVGEGEEGEAVPAGDVAEVSIATNTPRWGLAVRFTLPEGGKPKHRNAAARCRLVDEAGVVVSEQLIENGEVLLEGNGRYGYFTFFLEVDGLSDAYGVVRLTEPMVELEARLASGGQ